MTTAWINLASSLLWGIGAIIFARAALVAESPERERAMTTNKWIYIAMMIMFAVLAVFNAALAARP